MIAIRKCIRCGQLFDAESPSQSMLCEDCLMIVAAEESNKIPQPAEESKKPVVKLPPAIDSDIQYEIKISSPDMRKAKPTSKQGRGVPVKAKQTIPMQTSKDTPSILTGMTDSDWAYLQEFVLEYKAENERREKNEHSD